MPVLLRSALVALACAAPGSMLAAPKEQPLAPRRAGAGTSLFTSLPAENTGITAINSFEDARSWGELYREFHNGSLGTGVAIGDYDADGRPDVVVANKTAPIALYRNLGDFRFEDVSSRAGLVPAGTGGSTVVGWIKSLVSSEAESRPPWGGGVVFADVNNDGRLDISACRFGAPNLLFINRGDGTFAEEAAARGLAVSDASVVTAFCDYDRDGWLDVYVQTNLLDDQTGPEGRKDYLFRNDGTGVFRDVSDKLVPRPLSQGHSCAWWDYDRDGWPDLYVANDFAAPDFLYRNNRDGTFTDVAWTALPHTPYSAMGCDTGDVDNDGFVDLFVADMAATNHEKDQRTMAVARYVAPAAKPGEVAQVSRNMLYLGTGTDRAVEGAFVAGIAASDWTWSPRFEDFDCDGRIDLLVTNGMVREHHNVDLVERSGRAAAINDRIAVLRDSPVLEERNLAFRNEGGLRFSEVGDEWGFDEVGVCFGSATGDLDGDGDLDVVVARFNEPPAILRNDGVTGERVVFRLHGRESNRFGLGARLDLETEDGWQVRELWGVRGYQSSGEPALFFGVRPGVRLIQARVRWPNGKEERWTGLKPGMAYDLAEGQGETLDVESRATAALFTRRGATEVSTGGESVITPSALKSPRFEPRSLGNLGPSLAVADLDGDGAEEIIMGGVAGGGIVRVGRDLAQTPLTIAAEEKPTSAALDDGPILAFDANGDGHMDLLLSKTGDSAKFRPGDFALRLWFGDGGGGFHAAQPGTLPDAPISAGAIAAADFDRDGNLEVFVGARVAPGRYPRSTPSLMLRSHGDAWIDSGASAASGLDTLGMVTAALCSDVDDDGWVDLIVATEWGPLHFFRNHAGHLRLQSEGSLFSGAGAGWWTSLAAADFNRDGRLDYVVGNAGLNTHYRASPEHPAMLFELPTGRARPATALLEAYFEGGKRYPWRTRKDLRTAWPGPFKKYPTNNDFARATIEEIFGSDVISGAPLWRADELRSGIFMSTPGGDYRFKPLPDRAQIASVQGIAAGDADGDGMADILLLHNSADQVSGHWDGGLGQVLVGDGAGGFSTPSPRDSGFVVPGDGRALAQINLGRADGLGFVASRHRAAPFVFTKAPGLRRSFLVLRLSQPGPNSGAVGAKVEITWSDRSQSVAEIAAGGGYMTQSSPALFVGLGGSARPERLRIRWPDGSSSSHEIGSEPGELAVDKSRGIHSVP